jgi:hypothetical protein
MVATALVAWAVATAFAERERWAAAPFLARDTAGLARCLKVVAAVACRNKNNKSHPKDKDRDSPTNSSRKDNNSIPTETLRSPLRSELASAVFEI